MGNTTFNMKLTDTEREIMDFVTDVIYADYNYSRASMISVLFRNEAIKYLSEDTADGYQEEFFTNTNMSDEALMVLLKQKKREEDKAFIYAMGVEPYSKMIEKFHVEYPDKDCSYNEELLAEVRKEMEVKDNE